MRLVEKHIVNKINSINVVKEKENGNEDKSS